MRDMKEKVLDVVIHKVKQGRPKRDFIEQCGRWNDQVKALDNQRRQDLPKDFTPNGALYLFRWDFFKEHHAIYQDRDQDRLSQ